MVMKSIGETMSISIVNPKCPTPTNPIRGCRYSLVIYESKCSHDGERDDGVHKEQHLNSSGTSNVSPSKSNSSGSITVTSLIAIILKTLAEWLESFCFIEMSDKRCQCP